MVNVELSTNGVEVFLRNRLVMMMHGVLMFLGTAGFMVLSACSSSGARFATPDAAVGALASAVRSEDQKELKRILGRGAEEIISSGDEVADQQARERFLQSYDEKTELVSESEDTVTLQIGKDEWPMPIPIVKRGDYWLFDTRAGKEEILNRRIGRNERDVQQVCLAFVDAQREYKSQDRDGDGVLEYARKLISDPGQKNGLYWESGEDNSSSPMGLLVAGAAEEGYGRTPKKRGERRPYHGYYFKLLTSQSDYAPGGARDYLVDGNLTGGFAVVAWPADYGNSGVMTFMINHQGILYERNFGPRTQRIVSAMTEFDPGPEWDVSP